MADSCDWLICACATHVISEGQGGVITFKNVCITKISKEKESYQSFVEKGYKRASIYMIETMADRYLKEYNKVNTLIIVSRKQYLQIQ